MDTTTTTTIQDTTENQTTESPQFTLKINPNSLHRPSFQELIKSNKTEKEKLLFSADTFYSPQSHNSLAPNLWVSHLRSLISKAARHKDSQYAHNIIFSAHREQTDAASTKDLIKMISNIATHFTQAQRLDLTCNGSISSNMLESFGYQLGRRLVNLKHLSLTFEADSMKSLHEFVREISRNLTELRSFSLVPTVSSSSDRVKADEDVRGIASKISNCLSELRSLSVDFTNIRSMSSHVVQEFISKIARLQRLERLKFYFRNAEISIKDLEKSIQIICEKLTGLQHLEFRLNYGVKFPNKTLWFILSEISQNLVHLKHLDFNFYSCDMNISEEDHHLYTFKQLTNLKTLKLTLDSDLTLNPVIPSLSSIISHNFINLEVLSIQLGPTIQGLNQESLETLIFGTSSSLNSLHTLHIDFPYCHFQTSSWKIHQDHSNWEKATQRLKHLAIVFRHCKDLNEEILEVLAANIVFYLSNLESLVLSFHGVLRDQAKKLIEQRISRCSLRLEPMKMRPSSGGPIKMMFTSVKSNEY